MDCMSGLLEELLRHVEDLAAEVAALREQRATGLLDAAGAAELLSLTPEAVRTLAKRHKIPRVTLPNGRVRFEVDALLAWARDAS
jgi:hypothetical protein